MASLRLACLLCTLLATVAQASIRSDIQSNLSGDFGGLLRKWSDSSSRIRPLEELKTIALDEASSERSRYIALMGAASLAKLDGRPDAIHPVLQRLKKDPSWVLRSASLEASLQVRDPARTEALALELLTDPALVVRSRAVDLIASPASAPALARAALDPKNHPGGRALWVPQKAIRALVRLQAREELRAVVRQLGKRQDPSLRLELTAAAKIVNAREPGRARR